MSDARLFRCPQCGQSYEGSAEDIGSEFSCEKCGATFRLDPDAAAPVSGKRRPSGFGCWLGTLRRYAGFRGRARRREYWWANVFEFLLMFVAGFVDAIVEADQWIVVAIGAATLLPMLAVTARRLHDTDKSAWWMLLTLVPVLHLAYLAWILTNGDKGPNRFGPDPKAP